MFTWVFLPADSHMLMELQRVHLGLLVRSWPRDVELQEKLLGSAVALQGTGIQRKTHLLGLRGDDPGDTRSESYNPVPQTAIATNI